MRRNSNTEEARPSSHSEPSKELPSSPSESFLPTSGVGLKQAQREPVSVPTSQLASKIDDLAQSGDDPSHALADLGFKGTGSDRVKIGQGTFLSAEINTTNTSLVYSAHKMVARDPEKTNKQALTQILDEVGSLKSKNPDMEIGQLHDMAMKRLLPKKEAPKPTVDYSAPLTSFDAPSSVSSSGRVGLKQDRKAPVPVGSEELAGKMTDLAADGDDPKWALRELGFKGAGSDRVSIAGAEFQSCEVNMAAGAIFRSSHSLANVMPEHDAKGIINETLKTVAQLKKKYPDDTMAELTGQAVKQLRAHRQNPTTLVMV